MSDIFCVTSEGKLRMGNKDFSKETVKAALDHCGFVSEEKPKPYIFKAGDVARDGGSQIRIIIKQKDGLIAYNEFGFPSGASTQKMFEINGYIKIGELKDYLPKDE